MVVDLFDVPTSVAPLPPDARPLSARDAPLSRDAEAPPQWVGESPRLRRTVEFLRRVASSRAPVLVLGESGTGKELAAAELHTRSGRRGPFVALNCGALSETLAASELFGHARGAFTGAIGQRRGVFARADGGTVFLDEIGELPLPSQAMLLRVLETRRVNPLGAESEVPIDARLVCATHRDLQAMVRERTFREDLYHRISVLTVRMPALRSRPTDIDALLDHFARLHAPDVGHPIAFTPEARDAARSAPWPGNVRELRNAVHRAGFLCDGKPISAEALFPVEHRVAGGCIEIPRGSFVDMRRALIEAMVECEGSQRRAAEVLGLPRSTLGNWLRSAEE